VSAARPGPTVERALRLPASGAKARRVLVLVAAYIDAGRPDPSIRELAERAELHRVAVVAIVDQLEARGLLIIERGDTPAGERNTYRVP
jgi:DNA-binding MarR family transcriptional regulator